MNHQVGRLQLHFSRWKQITSDPTILNWVLGYKIPFETKPYQSNIPLNDKFSAQEVIQISSEINKLIHLKAIEICQFHKDQFCSPIFIIKKSNGSFRFILNLKKLNTFIPTEHFKLEDYRTVCKILQKNDFLVSIDLKDAYYMVSIHEESKKYLRFFFQRKLYQFNVLPFGLCTAPFTFTKIMKPIVAHLREKGFISVVYLDDYLCIGKDYQQCLENMTATIDILERLGFIINREKCNLTPNQYCKFLGFIFDTVNMTLDITTEKRNKCLKIIKELLNKKQIKIRILAQGIGTLVSVCPAIKYGMLYTRELERLKYLTLKNNNDNYEFSTTLNSSCKYDLEWWSHNIVSSINPIRKNSYKLEIFTDASNTGWGASCDSETASGHWSKEETQFHINSLELIAAFFGLKCFAKDLRNSEILLRIDNITAISYINRQGGVRYTHLHHIAKEIWQWCEFRNLWIYGTYINTKDNIIADFESRKELGNTEWELNDTHFQKIVSVFGEPSIDLFASRTNSKCQDYVSWHPDPGAIAVDAFTICWSNYYLFYAFPPFSMVLKTLEKIISDGATGIVVVPYWTTQPWFPIYNNLLVQEPILFQPSEYLLSLNNCRMSHPLHQKMKLMAGLLSGKLS